LKFQIIEKVHLQSTANNFAKYIGFSDLKNLAHFGNKPCYRAPYRSYCGAGKLAVSSLGGTAASTSVEAGSAVGSGPSRASASTSSI
jgi:hypothetical protein